MKALLFNIRGYIVNELNLPEEYSEIVVNDDSCYITIMDLNSLEEKDIYVKNKKYKLVGKIKNTLIYSENGVPLPKNNLFTATQSTLRFSAEQVADFKGSGLKDKVYENLKHQLALNLVNKLESLGYLEMKETLEKETKMITFKLTLITPKLPNVE